MAPAKRFECLWTIDLADTAQATFCIKVRTQIKLENRRVTHKTSISSSEEKKSIALK